MIKDYPHPGKANSIIFNSQSTIKVCSCKGKAQSSAKFMIHP